MGIKYTPVKSDPVVRQNLLNYEGDEWRDSKNANMSGYES